MADWTIYTYAGCSTCRNATRWLRDRGVAFEERPIRETPPSEAELATMLRALDGQRRRLCNTSSADYRASGLKDRIDTMDEAALFAELRTNGNLVKRPFLLHRDGRGTVGFAPERWTELTSQA